MDSTVRFTAKALLLALTTAPLFTFAQAPQPGDAMAQAEQYTKQAAQFRAQAERHREIARRHRVTAGMPNVSSSSIVQHCERIADSLTEAAWESEALARAYRAVASPDAR